MTPPHTPESLLALTNSPEGLEQMRIIAAEADGLTRHDKSYPYPQSSNGICKRIVWMRGGKVFHTSDNDLPNYPTSLDVIFAAEERLGLHDPENYEMRVFWYHQADRLSQIQTGTQLESHDMAFVSKLDRLICLLLTAQWKEQNL